MPGSGSSGYWAISEEVTAGTAITTPDFFYPVEEADVMWSNEYIDVQEIRGSRQAYKVVDGPMRPEASFKTLLYPAGALGLIFKGLLGKVSSALVGPSTTVYANTFSDNPTLPYFTVERADARSGEGGIICERVAGCKVEKVSLSCAYGEKVEMDVNFQAMKKPDNTAAPVTAASITYPAMHPLTFTGASIKVDSVADARFKSLKLDITNKLERQEVLNGSNEAYAIFEGGLSCTLTGSLVFESMDYYNKAKNGSEFSVELDLKGDVADAANSLNYQIGITWDTVRVSKFSVPFKAGDVIQADVEYRIIFNEATNRTLQVVMQNLEDGATVYAAS